MKTISMRTALLIACGAILGAAGDWGWHERVVPRLAAQQERTSLPTMESLPAEVAQLKALVPSNSHIMMDVQWHWTNLWFAGQKKNWPLAQYWFSEMRGHIIWLTRKSPIIRSLADGKDVDIKSMFEGV